MKQTAIAAVFALAIVVFAIQNADNVDVHFLFWNARCSMALLLVVVMIIGIIAGMLVTATGLRKRNAALRVAEKRIAKLERRMAEKRANKGENGS
jgi:uncharacterized integral membrane protein